MPIRSLYPDVEIPDVSLFDFLFAHVEQLDNRHEPALIDSTTGETMSYLELHDKVLAFAAALHERGVRQGDVVGILAPNSPQWVVVFHGALRANATVTTINSLYSGSELAHQLSTSGATLLVTVSELLPQAQEALAAVGLPPEAVITIDSAPGLPSLDELLRTTATPPALTVGSLDVAVMPFSAGTTGRAKGVLLTHRNLVANVLQLGALNEVGPGTRILGVPPFFHIYGLTGVVNQGLHRRATILTMPRFNLRDFLRLVAEHRIDRVYIAPPIALALAKDPIVDTYDLSSLRVICVGAAPLDAELGRAMGRRLNAKVLQGYGMTEMAPVSHCMPDDRPDLDLSSSGFAVPNIVCKVVDLVTGQEVGPGERGELWVSGPNVMRGYLDDAQATSQTVDPEGYLHTGDVVQVTEEGVFSIVDRVKELIKYKGYQVPPAELEALLLSNEAIADAAVIGVLDDTGEEIPKAFIVRRSTGADLTAEQVMAYVADRISPHKKVRRVEFIDQIPKSASGKILRRDLRTREAALVTAPVNGSLR